MRDVGTLLKSAWHSHTSGMRPRHPAQGERIIEALKSDGPRCLKRSPAKMETDLLNSGRPMSKETNRH